MKRKDIKKNYIYNLSYQLLSLIIPLITTPYISRVLGAEMIGKNSYAHAIVSYFCLFAAMGTVSYGQREISYYQDNSKKRTLKFWNTEILSCTSVFVVLMFYASYTYFISKDKILFAILTLNIITVAFDVSWFFQGMEEFGKIVGRNIVFKILSFIFIFIFVKSENDLYKYVLGLSLFTLLSAVSLWPFLQKYLIKINIEELCPFKDLLIVWSLFIPTIATSIYTLLDKTMIGWFSETSVQNGFYEQSMTIIKFALTFVTSLGTVMIPRIGYCFEQKDFGKIEIYMYRSYNFVWLLGIPMCFGVISTASNFVPWFLGEEFTDTIPLIRILSLLFLAIGVNNVTGMQYLIPTKRQNIFTKTVLTGAVVNFIMNICLIPFWGAVGAAIASVASESVIAVVQLFYVHNELNVFNIINTIWRYVIAGFVMFLLIIVLSDKLSPSIEHTLILVLTGVSVYFTVLRILRERFFFEVVRDFARKIKYLRMGLNG